MKRLIINQIVDFYLNSYDFNGIPITRLFSDIQQSHVDLLKELILKGLISINWGQYHENIHIQAYPPLELKQQIKWLNKLKLSELKPVGQPIIQTQQIIINRPSEKDFCIYPTRKTLINRLDRNKYKSKPFTKFLALGEPQLKPYFFDMSVLDDYMNDPRFHFSSDGISGSIYIKKESTVPKKDRIYVEHFGYGIKLDKKNYERCVAVFLCDLVDLSANQQQRWMTKMIRSKKYFLHPEYDKISRGIWELDLSVFYAIRTEITIINKMFVKAYRKKLFKRDDFTDEELTQFHFLIRPTFKLYYEFVHLLDKLISENIDKSFFDKSLFQTLKKENNNVDPGTLQLLDQWIDKKVRFKDPNPKKNMIKIFRMIRTERQKPAHQVSVDEWNKKYWNMQRKMIIETYGAIRTLRLIITNHRLAKSVDVPEWLYKGEICFY